MLMGPWYDKVFSSNAKAEHIYSKQVQFWRLNLHIKILLNYDVKTKKKSMQKHHAFWILFRSCIYKSNCASNHIKKMICIFDHDSLLLPITILTWIHINNVTNKCYMNTSPYRIHKPFKKVPSRGGKTLIAPLRLHMHIRVPINPTIWKMIIWLNNRDFLQSSKC